MTTFSIITVVYNDITHIKETMDSVINQSYKNIEYILIDGGSSDGTKEAILEIITSYATTVSSTQNQNKFYLEAIHNTHPTFTFKFLSEKDKGIYDAMNKGIALASREWINFANCGDILYTSDVLKKIASLNTQEYEIIYGDLNINYTDHNFYFHKKTNTDLKKLYRLFFDFGHPNCFIKTSIHKHFLYDTKYTLSSDYDLIYKLYRHHYKFLFTDIIVSEFRSGGASDKNGYKSLKEALKISISYNQNDFFVKIKIILFYIFAILKKTIKLYFPIKLSAFLIKKFYDKSKTIK